MDIDDYVPVNERLAQFRKDHPDWTLEAHLKFEGDAILARAVVSDETGRTIAVGHAEEIRDRGKVNQTSAVENCETSAWGRALAAAGYEVKRGIASREEIQRVSRAQGRSQSTRGSATPENVSVPERTPSRRTPVLPKDQALAKQAADHGIDDETRGDVIHAITKGRTRSGKDLEPHEVIWVATAYEELAAGVVDLRYDPDGTPRLGKPRVPAGNNPGPTDDPF